MNKQIQKLSQLPSLPTVAVRILNMFSDPEVSIAEVVFVLQTDPALSGKILKAANSSQLGLKKPVSDLQRAIVLLGKKSVMALALGFSLSEASMNTGPYAELYTDFWFQSLVRGCAASVLAAKLETVDDGEAFTIGLLARLGRLAMLTHEPESFKRHLEEAEATGRTLDEVESRSGLPTSHEISLYLLREWHLPEHCVRAVEDLHASLDQACAVKSGEASLTDVIRIASACSEFFSGEGRGLAIARIYELTQSILNYSQEEANELVDAIRQELDDHSSLFSVDMSKVGRLVDLLSQAMAQLSNLAISITMPREERRSAPLELMEENGRLRKRVLELTQSSMTDSLTSLYNRTYLMQRLAERVNNAREHQSHVGVLFIDLDHFKKINDTYGHRVGDEVLRTVARCIREVTRETDIVTRYGGEEFVILTSAPDRAGLERQAERVRRRIELQRITEDDLCIQITASIGGAIAVPGIHEPTFAMQLVEAADAAMYQSKRGGRNRATIVDELERSISRPAFQTAMA